MFMVKEDSRSLRERIVPKVRKQFHEFYLDWWPWLLVGVFLLSIVIGTVLWESFRSAPSTEDRVEVLEVEVQKLQEEVKQQEELREEAVFGLWETINVTERRCDECIHSCGGLD